MKWVVQILQQDIFPNFYVYLANRKVKARYDQLRAQNISISLNDSELAKLREILEKYQEAEAERTKIIEEKARSSLFIIALSVTLSLTIVGLVKGVQLSALAVLSFATCVLAVAYLIMACVTALRVINIQEFHSLSISEFVTESGGSLELVAFTEGEHTSRLYKDLVLNQHVNIAKANFLYATLIGIRNGILLFALFFLLLLMDKPDQLKLGNEPLRVGNIWINHADSSAHHYPMRDNSRTITGSPTEQRDTINRKK